MSLKFPDYNTLIALVNQIFANAYDKESGEKEDLTLRQIYYKLVVMGVIDNTINNYKLLSKKLTIAREQGDLDGDRIVDRHRQVHGGDFSRRSPDTYYADHERAFRNCWEEFSLPFWSDQPHYVEVFLEKDALSGPVVAAASAYNAVVCVNRGYASYSYLSLAAKRIANACETSGRLPHILYLGDHDPSGHNMVGNLESRLRKYGLDGLLGENPLVEKIGVLPSQIEEMHLPTIPLSDAKERNDRRSKKFIEEFGRETVELDVFDNEQLKTLVRTAIESYIEVDTWNYYQQQSEKMREDLHERIENHFRGVN